MCRLSDFSTKELKEELKSRKEPLRLLWKPTSMKVKFERQAHWMDEGHLDGKHLFNRLCPYDEPVRVLLEDLSTGHTHEMTNGSLSETNEVALSLLNRAKSDGR